MGVSPISSKYISSGFESSTLYDLRTVLPSGIFFKIIPDNVSVADPEFARS